MAPHACYAINFGLEVSLLHAYLSSNVNQIAHETGYRYHYMMVLESNPIEGAHTTGDVLKLIEAL
ncbi:hypothetical protein LIN78_16180 [Leeia sp. TBRC 13508]|uniref:Uncharacterized protein n=1 Tax=Leeia speluncae TaxID=2884804 RepID=A0ABS8DA53_9NEIS|nr:hypothetical protein [Leeia speluncae]MCB6185086.1 hypothetical protein [Leeia speluncae]